MKRMSADTMVLIDSFMLALNHYVDRTIKDERSEDIEDSIMRSQAEADLREVLIKVLGYEE